MLDLPFTLDGQTLKKLAGFPYIAEKSKDFLRISVDGIPEGFYCSAFFSMSWEKDKVYDVEMSDGKCIIPEYCTMLPEVINDYIDYDLYVSIAGVNPNGERLTSDIAKITLKKTNYSSETSNTPEMPESQYQRFEEAYNLAIKAYQDASEIREMADDGYFDGKDGVDGYGLLPVEQVIPQPGGAWDEETGLYERYRYEVYIGTDYKELPSIWMLAVYLNYGMRETDTICIYGSGLLFESNNSNYPEKVASKGNNLFIYDGSKLRQIVGAKGETGEKGDTGEKGNKGDAGGAPVYDLLYENSSGLNSTSAVDLFTADTSLYDHFVVDTNRGKYAIWKQESGSGYISGGTNYTVGGSTMYVVSICFGVDSNNKWSLYDHMQMRRDQVDGWSNNTGTLYKVYGVRWVGGSVGAVEIKDDVLYLT